MKITTEKLNDANVRVTGTLAASDIDAHIDALARETGKQIKVDGFRKGKVPVHVVKKLYGDKLAQDAEGEALRDLIRAAYEEAGIEPSEILGDPAFKKYEKTDSGIDIEILLALRPTIDTADYRSVVPSFEKPVIDDKAIDARVETLAKQVAEAEPIEAPRPLENGDVAVFDFEGFLNGEPFEGGKAEQYELEIGSGQFIPGFEEGMLGMQPGEEKRITVRFPDDYQAENLRGQTTEFVVKLHTIKEKKVGKIDDALAQKITRDTTATVESMRQGIQEQLYGEAISQLYNDQLKPALIEALVKHFTFDLPETIVEQEIDNLVNQKAQTMSREEIEAVRNDSARLDALRDEVRDDAQRSVKATFIVDALAREEKLSVSDDEVKQVLQYEAVMAGQNPNETVEYYEKNGLLPAAKMSLLEDKLFTRLLGLDNA